MVFCETKAEANELSMNPAMKVDAQVLHGDIAQNQREITLKVQSLEVSRIVVSHFRYCRVGVVGIFPCRPPLELSFESRRGTMWIGFRSLVSSVLSSVPFLLGLTFNL